MAHFIRTRKESQHQVQRRDTPFRYFYTRGDLPVTISNDDNGRKILAWKVDIEKLDYNLYLPIFFDGLREKQYPYNFLALQGTLHIFNDALLG